MPEAVPATLFPRQPEKGTLHIDVVIALELRQLLRTVFVPRQERVRAPVPRDNCAQRSPLGLHSVLDVLGRNSESQRVHGVRLVFAAAAVRRRTTNNGLRLRGDVSVHGPEGEEQFSFISRKFLLSGNGASDVVADGISRLQKCVSLKGENGQGNDDREDCR